MVNNKLVKIVLIFLVILNIPFILGQEEYKQLNLLLEKNGLSTTSESLENIKINSNGDIVINKGISLNVNSEFNGFINGGLGGGRIIVSKKTIILLENAYARIINGQIIELQNAHLIDEIDLGGHNVKGAEISYSNGIITSISDVYINGVKIENLNSDQPINIKLKSDGSYFIYPKATTTTIKIDGKEIRLKRNSHITLNNGDIIDFSRIDIPQRRNNDNFIDFKGLKIYGNDLSVDNMDVKFSKISLITNHGNLNFISPNMQTPIVLDGNRYQINSDWGALYQTDLDNQVLRKFYNGQFEFDNDKPGFSITSENGKFEDYTVGPDVLDVSVERNLVSSKAVKFHIGQTNQNEPCHGSSTSCFEITKERILNGVLMDDVDVRINYLEKGESNFYDSNNFPFRFVNVIISTTDAYLSIENQNFNLYISSRGSSISSSTFPEDLRAIVVKDQKNDYSIITKKGMETANNGKVASFQKQVLNDILIQYQETGGYTRSEYQSLINQMPSLQQLKKDDLEVYNFVTEGLIKNPFYRIAFVENSNSRFSLSDLNQDKLNELSIFLSNTNKDNKQNFDFISDYIYQNARDMWGDAYGWTQNKPIPGVVDPIELEHVKNFYVSRPYSDELLFRLDPEEVKTLDSISETIGIDNEQNYNKLRDLYFGGTGYQIEPLVDTALWTNKYDIGIKNPEDYYKMFYSFMSNSYDSPPAVNYNIRDLQAMYKLYEDFEYINHRYDAVAMDIYMKPLVSGETQTIEALNEFISGGLKYMLFQSNPNIKDEDDRLLELNDKDIKYMDLQNLNKVVKHLDSFMLDKNIPIENRNSVGEYLMGQSRNIYYYINAFHNEGNLRTELVDKLPPEFFFYLTAAAYNNIGTSSWVYYGQSQVYPSSHELVVKTYQKHTDVLKDSLKYQDTDLFDNFLFSLSDRQDLSSLIIKTSSDAQQIYIDKLFSETVFSPQNSLEKETKRKGLSKSQLAIRSLSNLLKNKDAEDQVIQYLKNEMLQSSSVADYPLSVQYLVLENKDKFTDTELQKFDPNYDPISGQFHSFDRKVKIAHQSNENILIEKMIKTDQNGKRVLQADAFFGSLNDKKEASHYDDFKNRLISELGLKEDTLQQYVEYNGKRFNYIVLSKEVDITYTDENGQQKTEKVNVEVKLNPRQACNDDVIDGLKPLYFTRGHIGGSSDSLETLLMSNSNIPDYPVYANLGGCYEYSDGTELIKQNSDYDLRVSGTTGTGKGDINNIMAVATIESIMKGISNGKEQQEYISNRVSQAICRGECTSSNIVKLNNYEQDLYRAWQKYGLYSDLNLARLEI